MADPTEVESTYWNEAQPGTIADANLFLLKEKRHCDVTFSFENLEREIEAHQLVLRARSRVFDRMFRGQGTLDGRREVKIIDTDPARFQELLEFIYADKFEVIDVSVALQLLHLAHKYEIEPLIVKCKQVLWTRLQVDNALEVFQAAEELGSLDDLKEKAANIMARSLHILARNEIFLKGAEKETLKYLLSRENLPIPEVDLFNLALRWGKSHLQRNEAADHKALKRVLAEILPLVRYPTMTAKEISTVVVPTKLLSPCQLVDVYSYLCGDPSVRRRFSRKRNFNPVPRQRPHGVVVFIHEEGSTVRRKNEERRFPLTESLSFCISELHTIGQANRPEEDRRLAITGIIVQWPARAVAPHTSENLPLNFYVCLLRFEEDEVRKEAVDCMFRSVTRNCSPGNVVEVQVVPAMEISCPQSFCVVIKDELDQYGGDNPVERYEYSWQAGTRKLKDSVCADFGNVMLELTDIQRNADMCRLPDNVYDKVRTVRGIRIASI